MLIRFCGQRSQSQQAVARQTGWIQCIRNCCR